MLTTRFQNLTMLMALAVLVLFALSDVASAATVELSWDMPTTREDGSAIKGADIAKTTIYSGDTVLAEVPAPATSTVIELPACSAASLTATVTDKSGLVSESSNSLSVLICRPSPPRLSGVRVPPVN